jgi:hypothetical protein
MPTARAISAIPPSSTRRSRTDLEGYAAKLRAGIDPERARRANDPRRRSPRRARATTPRISRWSTGRQRGRQHLHAEFQLRRRPRRRRHRRAAQQRARRFRRGARRRMPSASSAAKPMLPGPGKRPLSSMSPTIVLKDGKPVLVTGTPGGSRIITTVLQVIVNVLDLQMDRRGGRGAAHSSSMAAGSEGWSGRRDSNPRPRPWQGRALPLSYTRIRPRPTTSSPSSTASASRTRP